MAGIPLKESRWDWLKQTFLYEIAGAILTFASAVWKLRSDHHTDFWLLLALTGLFALSFVKNIILWKNKKQETSCHELAGCLYTLHGLLTASGDESEPDPKLRITLHKPIEDGQRLQQVLDYVGNDRAKNTAGRKFSANCGSAGEALRLKRLVYGERENDDYEKYIAELVEHHHYTESDARKMDRDTMSWVAMPFFVDGDQSEVEAVLYLDSTVRDFFTEARRQTVLSAVSGISRFVKHRYP